MRPHIAERPLRPPPLYAIADGAAVLGVVCSGDVRRNCRLMPAAVETAS